MTPQQIIEKAIKTIKDFEVVINRKVDDQEIKDECFRRAHDVSADLHLLMLLHVPERVGVK